MISATITGAGELVLRSIMTYSMIINELADYSFLSKTWIKRRPSINFFVDDYWELKIRNSGRILN